MTSEVISIDPISVSQKNKNAYVSNFIRICEEKDISDDSLWEQFQKDFEEWTENDFKSDVFNTRLRHLRNFLRRRDVWVSRDKNTTIAKSLYATLQEESPTKWTEEEMLRCMPHEKFISNTIELLMKTDFDRNPKDYSWQAQRRSFNQPPPQANRSVNQPLPRPVNQPPSRSVNQPPPRSIPSFSVPPPLSTPQRPPASLNQLEKERQPGEQPDGQSGERPGEQSGGQSDEPPVKPSAEQSDERPDGQSDEPPVKPSAEQSDGRPDEQSDEPPVKPSAGPPPVGPSVKPSAESPPDGPSVKHSVGPSVKPPDESSDEPSVEPSVERPFKPPYDWRSSTPLSLDEKPPYR